MALNQDLQNAEVWPIKAKGAVVRLNPLGNPKFEKLYHKSLEQGRLEESSIADANHELLAYKQYVLDKINAYFSMNTLAIDGQNKRRLRKFLYALDSINFLKQVNNFQKDILGVISAVTTNIGMLQSIEQNMLQMVQANLNALANLVNNICNWGLPDLPAIPNLFSDTLWQWNGFNFFPLAAFQPHVRFDKNFAFNMCVIHVPNVNIFRNFPSTVQSYSGLQYGTPAFVPPLGGIIPNTGVDLGDPNVVAQFQGITNEPIFGSTFNPNTSMLGSVPDPSTIISNYQMPSGTYRDNIISLVAETRDQVIEPSDADYNNPDLAARSINLRKSLIHFINLKNVIASNYDPFITSAWLFYLDNARQGRAGAWIDSFEAEYGKSIQPSINSLTTNAVPYNNVLGGAGVVNTPKDIPFVDVVKGLTSAERNNLLWRLSFIEASLLGYTRFKDWDTGADAAYLQSFTGSDLDYTSTTLDKAQQTSIILGTGTAQFPTTCLFPTAMATVLNAVIELATIAIQNSPEFVSSRPQLRSIFDQFSQRQTVDRYTQFWREFNYNLQTFLTGDGFVVNQVVSYPETLNGAINPLADSSTYTKVKTDANSRNRNWTAGTPLLNIPKAPVVTITSNFQPDAASNGWIGNELDPASFLARPDVQALPIPTQIAMLRTNLSFAGLMQFRDSLSSEIGGQIASAQSELQNILTGFRVTAKAVETTVPAGGSAAVGYDDSTDQTLGDFDFTGNVTNKATFTLQQAGVYAVTGQLNFSGSASGFGLNFGNNFGGQPSTRTVNIMLTRAPNSPVSVYTTSTDPSVPTTGPVTLQFSANVEIEVGDVIQVLVSHNGPIAQTVLNISDSAAAGLADETFFSMMLTPSTTASTFSPDTAGGNSTKDFTSNANMAAMTAFKVGPTGNISPVDPTIITRDTSVTLSDNNHPIITPYPDGVTLGAATIGGVVTCGVIYGGVYQAPSDQGWVNGALLYVNQDGTITQNFNAIANPSANIGGASPGNMAWVICIGRAVASDTFIYEPHIPSQTIPE